MTRKPAFWIAYASLAVLCAIFSYRFFPRAFPIVSLDITMSRDSALASAATLAAEHNWGPAGESRAAASFTLDDQVQTFVELEAGGAEAFNAMLRDPLYTPYTWRVRRFHEGDVNETNIHYRPDGRPFGFRERIAEDATRPSLSAADARALGERLAASAFHIDLTTQELVESGQEQRPNGRIDHTFMYERKDNSLGAGRYRVKVVVSGDRVSEIMPFVRVPEAFKRRYEEMRSANNVIGTVGTIGALGLYLLVGCGIGCFYLLRQRALLWRPALLLAGIITSALILAEINQWPLHWLQYDTALPSGQFVLQTLLSIVIQCVGLGLIMAISFMAAEGLSRRAFPQHPQFWSIWRRQSAPSLAIAGRTAAGILAVPFMLSYLMLFYFFAGRWWGWWNPSDSLVSPDSLAHYAPWFTPFATAMQAGVWEESLFRAVPLASAALLGQRYGRRGLFIGIALVLQALIFGSAHATYPTQPAYARLVELIIPSLAFGLFYLRYGLLPSMVLHFTFDIVLMSLPIYASSGGGVWLNRVLVAVLTLTPALVVVVQRVRSDTWLELPESLRNIGWSPPAVETRAAEARVMPEQHTAAWPHWLLPVLGIFCLVALPVALWQQEQARPEVPVLGVTKAQAEQIARDTLDTRAVKLQPATRVLVSVLGAPAPEDRFVWKIAGKDVYEKLIGDWLHPPRYFVRFARFEGDVAERADEWVVTVTGNGEVRTVRHLLAEGATGESLGEDRARELAYAALERDLQVKPESVRVVSVEPKKQPARTDWTITFADTAAAPLLQGERRLQVDIAGAEVIGTVKMIHVPEEWQREQRALDAPLNILSVVRVLVFLGIGLAGVIAGIIAWVRGHFLIRYFLSTTLALTISGGVALICLFWPTASAQFSTAQPFIVQGAVLLAVLALLIGAGAVAAGLVAGMAIPWRRPNTGIGNWQLIPVGILWALALRALGGLTIYLFGTDAPAWPATSTAASLMPALAVPVMGAIAFCLYTLPTLLVMGYTDRFTAGWTRRRGLALVLLFLLGAISYGSPAAGTLAAWAVSALAMGLATVAGYWLLIRHDLALIPLITGTTLAFSALPSGEQAYPGARLGNVLAIIIVIAATALMFRSLRRVDTPHKSINHGVK